MIKSLINGIASSDFLWKFARPFSILGVVLSQKRQVFQNRRAKENFQKLFPELKVQNGPFKGMVYPELGAVGSTIYPKIIGSYERELWPTIEQLIASSAHSEIIDIGCAEGYYAVGAAMIDKNSIVYAYDINDKARQQCGEMAKANGVSDRVVVKSECSAQVLADFDFKSKGLIICDCEGFERQLFNEQNRKNLMTCDILIEMHDFIDPSISPYLKKLFAETHKTSIVKSISDIDKARSYRFDRLDTLSVSEKTDLFAERRPAIMEWLICEAKG